MDDVTVWVRPLPKGHLFDSGFGDSFLLEQWPSRYCGFIQQSTCFRESQGDSLDVRGPWMESERGNEPARCVRGSFFHLFSTAAPLTSEAYSDCRKDPLNPENIASRATIVKRVLGTLLVEGKNMTVE